MYREPTVMGRKPGLKSMIWNRRNKRSTRTERRKKEFKKNEVRLRNHNFKSSNIGIIGVTEGEEKEQEMENLFEKIMKENFPNLAKEIDFQEL